MKREKGNEKKERQNYKNQRKEKLK